MSKEKNKEIESLNRCIVRMTVPTVLSNISVPLLGLCDTAVAGHMSSERYLAAIAIGSVMMTTVYWLFSFLRAGTSGLTAACYGASDRKGMGDSLLRSVAVAVVIGLLLMALKSPLLHLLGPLIGASPEVTQLSARYFSICLFGAVPFMTLTALTGWFIGMQSTTTAMLVNIGMSIINVAATLSYVYCFGMGFDGIAYGTLTAQWVIIVPAVLLAIRLCRKNGVKTEANNISGLFDRRAWKRMFGVNSNLFFRSACLIALSMMLYSYSARLGDVEVSANAVINQLFLFFSYFMDGFAFTGEALIGRYNGAGDFLMLRKSKRALLKWTMGIAILFALAYSLSLSYIVRLLSDSPAVGSVVQQCVLWVSLVTVAGASAFIYDGFYVGLAKTRPMLISTLCGVALFTILMQLIPHTLWMLWMAFTCYLALRSLLLIILFPHRSIFN